ncbi:uncharacterized protein LOC134242302 isoform X2 [Saccostrea cucullata]|uniref:uncharacterized protein LOC134242302 isoform X2 n=1 Tax=Saccostrea cuccullata TaxID=36930 RepID=UPI002ED32FC2
MRCLCFFIKTVLSVIGVFGSCPQNSPNIVISSCDGILKSETELYIDFTKINQPCNCIVIPAFDGDLFVRAEVNVSQCDAFVRVNNTFLFNCQEKVESSTVKVKKTHPVTVEADFKSESSRTSFYHCLRIQENGGRNGLLEAKCGTSTFTSTQSLTDTSATIIHQTSSQILLTTIPFTLQDKTVSHTSVQEGPSNLPFQISLGIFVMIAFVSVMLNVHFFNIIRRNTTAKNSSKEKLDRSGTNQSNADTYTELEMSNVVTATTASTNQYDSLQTENHYLN